ncbi:hypothetical protein T484DRAFT_1865191 [Baffinella frigidus]|nr:hypothetical protein T484DRAFT_1865191 [Cryptophyta sp. CCMP2293]
MGGEYGAAEGDETRWKLEVMKRKLVLDLSKETFEERLTYVSSYKLRLEYVSSYKLRLEVRLRDVLLVGMVGLGWAPDSC